MAEGQAGLQVAWANAAELLPALLPWLERICGFPPGRRQGGCCWSSAVWVFAGRHTWHSGAAAEGSAPSGTKKLNKK